jgi:CRP-like cAMP-binding protein
MAKKPTVDLRDLKDKATRAFEKRSWVKAAELYVEIAQHEDDPDWRHRAGEAYRKAGKHAEAAEQLVTAADGYAHGGFLFKAIAMCKVVLQVDPKHTATQKKLVELYALREAPSAPAPARVVLPPPLPPPVPHTPPRAEPPPLAPPPVLQPLVPADDDGFVDAPAPLALDLSPAPAPLPETMDSISLAEVPALKSALAPGDPIESIPLRETLGGRRSAQFPAVRPEEHDLDGSAYEIELDEPSIEIIHPAPAPAPVAVRDEMDFSDVMAAEPAPAPAPAPVAVRDEMDFSDVMAAEPAPAPAPAPVPVAAPRPALPKIPLFSSLAPPELERLINEVELREFEPGQAIVRQGERGGALYVVVSGEVAVTADDRDLARLGEGAFFGELALITDFPRSATVTAREPTRVLEISREAISRVIADSPEVLKVLLRFFRDRMLDRLITTSPVFNQLPPDDAQTLVGRFKFLELEPRMRVIREGERAPGMFLLLAGRARVVKDGLALAQLQPGDLFGEMSLLRGGPAMAAIETETKCWVIELERKDFQEIMMTYPQLLEFVSTLAERRQAENSDGGRVEFL